MSIGKWIVVAFVLFAGFIATLVTVCVRQDINLVSKEYYKEELAYQEQIVRISNTRSLDQKPVVVVDGDVMEVRFASGTTVTKGTMKLFCPSNPAMDREFDLIPLASNARKVEIGSLNKGMYRAKIYWQDGDLEYYHEEIINL
jgi:hypothetical protein